jgi:hypothetical protein
MYEVFDSSNCLKFVGKNCIYKDHSWSTTYTSIYVIAIDVESGLIKYTLDNRPDMPPTIQDLRSFDGKIFKINPFGPTKIERS